LAGSFTDCWCQEQVLPGDSQCRITR